MANDMKSGIGFVIPAAGIVGFFVSLVMREFLFSIIIAVCGILVWFIYMLVMESNMPQELGNIIILFGVLLSMGIFFGFGITQNMWGGFELEPEGSIFSLIILFFAVLTGLNFRNQHNSKLVTNENIGLTDKDREFVMSAIDKSSNTTNDKEDPRVIIVKQESETKNQEEKDKNIEPSSESQNNPYAMPHNPYFTYPPDYYYDEDDEDEYEDEYEDEDEWEDEWEDEN
tara:strand:- start:3695 stop:4378 length:684 start_codon:yes stop_codon:yes gene_type:complete